MSSKGYPWTTTLLNEKPLLRERFFVVRWVVYYGPMKFIGRLKRDAPSLFFLRIGFSFKRLVVGVLIAALLGIVAVYRFPQVFQHAVVPAQEEAASTTVEVVPAYTMERSSPLRLRIPKLFVDAAFEEPLGLKDNKEIEVPEEYDTVGWYKYGPTPGSLGPAVVLGHVDSREGAAVFYTLGLLEPGDSVFIDREDGTTAEFIVESKERVNQSEFPTERVYGNLDHAGLRLITCTGNYDHGELRYDKNLIVYLKLREPNAQ